MAIRKNLSKHLSGLPNVVSLLFNSDSYCLSQRHSGLSPVLLLAGKTVVCPLFYVQEKPWSVPCFAALEKPWSVPYFAVLPCFTVLL